MRWGEGILILSFTLWECWKIYKVAGVVSVLKLVLVALPEEGLAVEAKMQVA